ncbi:MAG: ABC transporter permease [Burkholderiaceae bacterium]
MKSLLVGLLTLALGLGAWQALVWLGELPPYLLPSPARVALVLWQHRAMLAEHAAVTLVEVSIGLISGVVLGTVTALLTTRYGWLRRLIMPWLLASQAIPVFALAPLFVLWFGYGMGSKIAMALLIIYFPVTSSLVDGLSHTDPALLDLARTTGAGPWRTLLRLRLPQSLPSLASGMRLAAVYAPIGAVIGEWVGASAGLGYLMLYANARVKIDLMFAALVVLATMTMLLYWSIGGLGMVLERWARGGRRPAAADA